MSDSADLSPVSVVICTHLYARRASLEAALESVAGQSLPPRETVVVVDGDVRLARHLRDRIAPAQLVVLEQRSGLSAARNAGVVKVAAPLVAFLDDDATADRDWLRYLVAGFETEDVVGVGGWSEPVWEGSKPGWFPAQLLWVVGCSYEGLPLERTAVRNVFGGCACYRKAAFDEVGGFRADLGRTANGLQGAEETEFCLRVKERGSERRFIFEPAARINHRVPRSRVSLRYIARRSWQEGRAKARIASLHGAGSLRTEQSYVAQTALSVARRGPAGMRTRPRETVIHAVAVALSVGCAALGFMSSLPGTFWSVRRS
jgi:GT2 family glycosyltransferase